MGLEEFIFFNFGTVCVGGGRGKWKGGFDELVRLWGWFLLIGGRDERREWVLEVGFCEVKRL